ncbi:MAG TPA: winged helix-turn-helix domain-containing protein [Elusimicrobiota bacterium]|nr:winged helix-turn-helix domain-containing protein [Elusimicrobiota bacterium]
MARASLFIVSRTPLLARRWAKLFDHECSAAVRDLEKFRFAGEEQAPRPDLVLLDYACLTEPQADFLRRLKAIYPKTSFILTSFAFLDNSRIVEMLEAGADDYFSQSFPPDLVRAKIRAHLRRIGAGKASRPDAKRFVKGGKNLRLNVPLRRVYRRADGARWEPLVFLTPSECVVLEALFSRAPAPVERGMLRDLIARDADSGIRISSVDKHIESLRGKLAPEGRRIRTIYGKGYSWDE